MSGGSAKGRVFDVAIIGAGFTGLTAARVLSDQGRKVVVVDKARGPGGRMSTRREGRYRFDHGAQYFTARDARFVRQVAAWEEQGVVRLWDARIGVMLGGVIGPETSGTQRYVPVPDMSAVCRRIARAQEDCRFNWCADRLAREPKRWSVRSETGDTVTAETLVITTPPAQTRQLLGDQGPCVNPVDVTLLPCWAVMVVFDRPVLTEWDAVFVNDGPLSWIASQAAKPERSAADAWVLHGGPEWSRENLEQQPEWVAEHLISAALDLPGAEAARVLFARAHRWRHSIAARPLAEGALWLPSQRLAIAGDWCAGSRVEGAFLSGVAAARRILDFPIPSATSTPAPPVPPAQS